MKSAVAIYLAALICVSPALFLAADLFGDRAALLSAASIIAVFVAATTAPNDHR